MGERSHFENFPRDAGAPRPVAQYSLDTGLDWTGSDPETARFAKSNGGLGACRGVRWDRRLLRHISGMGQSLRPARVSRIKTRDGIPFSPSLRCSLWRPCFDSDLFKQSGESWIGTQAIQTGKRAVFPEPHDASVLLFQAA